MPAQSVPCYVAKELSRLPPLSMNCFDVSSPMKDTESFKLHRSILQESLETLLEAQLATCQERHETAPSSDSEHRSPDFVCDDSGKADLHINVEADLPEIDNDDLILLARFQQEKPPLSHGSIRTPPAAFRRLPLLKPGATHTRE